MSETTTESAETTTEQAPNDGAEQGGVEALGDAGKKALDRMKQERNAARDQANSLQAQLDQIKQSQMSELEKAQAQAKTFEEQATKAAADALRWRIAAKHGISDDDAETFLTGADEATLVKQAERLASLAVKAPTTPKPDATQGGTGSPPALNSDQLENALRSKLGITA